MREAAQKQTEAEEAAAELERRGTTRAEAEAALAAEETLITEQLRAAADRRTGLATLRGRVDAIDGRLEASQQRGDRARAQRRSDQGALEASAADLEQLRQRNEEADSSGAELEAAYEAARAAQGSTERTTSRRAPPPARLRSPSLSAVLASPGSNRRSPPPTTRSPSMIRGCLQRRCGARRKRRWAAPGGARRGGAGGDAAFGRELVDRGEFSAALTIGQAVIKDGERIRGERAEPPKAP